jgi:uncharacterized protein
MRRGAMARRFPPPVSRQLDPVYPRANRCGRREIVAPRRYVLVRKVSSMREIFSEALTKAVKAQDKRRTGTLRLITAAIKDRDIAQRGAGKDPLSDDEIRQVLVKMVKQRQESAKIYEDNARAELAAQEREEIAIIEEFLPAQLDEGAVQAACRQVVADTGAQGLRDVGRCMNTLKERYAGQMDFAKASGVVKELLR